MLRFVKILGFICVVAPFPVFAGPFGVEMGTPIGDLDANNQANKFVFNSVPSPHPLFVEYSGWHSKSFGVCRIVAGTEKINNDAFGDRTRDTINKVRIALEEKYGPARKIEVLKSGTIWDESKYWTMSLYKNERTFAADWENAKSGDETYSLIQLWAVGLSNDDTAVILEYRSPDFESCNKEIEASLNSSF